MNTTTPEAVEAALKYASVCRNNPSWINDALEFEPHCSPDENIDQAAVRILAARVRELELEREWLANEIVQCIEQSEKRLRHEETHGDETSQAYFSGERCAFRGLLTRIKQHPQPEQAKEADEVLYGLEGQELLDDDVETIVSHVLHTNCEKPGESFDVVADRIQWPVKVLEFRRMKVSETAKNSLADSTLESVIEQLDEDHAGPDGTSNKPTAPMQLAARRFIDEVTRHYVVWSCEPTGEVIEITREQSKEIVA